MTEIRPQFTIASLFWLTALVAAFFAGLGVHRGYEWRLMKVEGRLRAVDKSPEIDEFRDRRIEKLELEMNTRIWEIKTLQVQVGGLHQDVKDNSLPKSGPRPQVDESNVPGPPNGYETVLQPPPPLPRRADVNGGYTDAEVRAFEGDRNGCAGIGDGT